MTDIAAVTDPYVDANYATVAVAGSCPTRDNFNTRFNPDYRRWYRCRALHQPDVGDHPDVAADRHRLAAAEDR